MKLASISDNVMSEATLSKAVASSTLQRLSDSPTVEIAEVTLRNGVQIFGYASNQKTKKPQKNQIQWPIGAGTDDRHASYSSFLRTEHGFTCWQGLKELSPLMPKFDLAAKLERPGETRSRTSYLKLRIQDHENTLF